MRPPRLGKQKAPPKRGFSREGARVPPSQSLSAADWRAMKLSKLPSQTRNHRISSFRNGRQFS